VSRGARSIFLWEGVCGVARCGGRYLRASFLGAVPLPGGACYGAGPPTVRRERGERIWLCRCAAWSTPLQAACGTEI
jgi:hypothetical protein